MKSVLSGVLSFAASAAVAATCTFDGAWDTVPSGEADDIVITSGALTWDASLPAKVKSWTQTGGTVTIGTTFDPAIFPCLEVSGDISLTGGTWTHKQNNQASLSSLANKYRLYVKCGGAMTIGADAVITGTSLGYESLQKVNGHSDTGTQGGSYGGHGAMATAKTTWTYGSFFAPEELGNAGIWSGKLYGGGSVRLDVVGALAHAGTISVDSYPATQYYAGAGGSIFIHAGAISGAGTLTADSAATQYGGSGGRIAVILTGDGADFSDFDIFNQASAIQKKAASNAGACGTIYAETKADGENHGWLILKGNGTEPTDKTGYYADPFSFELTSARLSKITIAGKTKLALEAGYTLDITDTVFDARVSGYGLLLRGGTLTADAGTAVSINCMVDCRVASTVDIDDLTIASGGILKGVDTITLPGNLTVASGGKLTTDAASSTPTHRLDVAVVGNLTVEEGGSISVTGCGYSKGVYPGGTYSDMSGGSHAGRGINSKGVENVVVPYGSIVNPLTPGAGGGQDSANSSAGGGTARLVVGGCLTIDGSILANGGSAQHYAGAGGSINVTAASLQGGATGLIEASCGKVTNPTAAGAGGRVAVKLTGAGSDFSSFLGSIAAYSYGNSNGGKYGGAGTVYLQTAAQGADGGTLILDNGAAKKVDGSTLVGGGVEGTSFGDIIIRNKAKLVLAEGATVTVKGDFRNESVFSAGADSTVLFAGTGDSIVSGNNTFVNLGCTAGGKTIKFTAGSTQTVTGAMTVAGEGEAIKLASTETGTAWNLDTSAGSAALSGVAIGDCQSVSAVTVMDGEDLGGNVHVTVQGSVEPETITWSGAVDGGWAHAENWNVRVPTKVDTVIIPAGTRTATLAANVKVAALVVAGTLDVGDKGITVSGDLTVSGSLVAASAAPIVVGGNLSATGTFTSAESVVTLNGAAAQTVSCGENFSFASLVVASSAVAFSGHLACSALTIGPGAFQFADGMTVSATSLTVNGSEESPNVLLRAATDDGVWYLKTSMSSVTGARVSGSDASGGVAIVPAHSEGVGDKNVNWLFVDTRLRWTGAADTDFANAANWQGGVAPTATDPVVIEGDYAVVVSEPTTVAGLTLGLGATMRVNAAMTVNGSLAIEPQGTLVANRPMTIAANLAVVDGAAVTHDVNRGVETNKVDLTVGGTAYFAAQSSVSVKGKGYQWATSGLYLGPGSANSRGESFAGASYGGRGWYGANVASNCYGSIVNPTRIGSAGGWFGNGGGAFILKVAGALTLEAEINADGASYVAGERNQGYYSASGGTINITAASLTGSGSLRACGGLTESESVTCSGGGGRIAVVLTDSQATFDGYAGAFDAYGCVCNFQSFGSAGTIFTKTPTEAAGTLCIANHDPTSSGDKYVAQDKTDFPKTLDNDPNETKGLKVVVRSYGTLNLTADADIASLEVAPTARVLLNGHKLRVHQRKPTSTEVFSDARVDASAGGSIVWNVVGTAIIIR